MKAECMARVLEKMVQEGKFRDMDEALNGVFRDRQRIWELGRKHRASMGLGPWAYDKPKHPERPKKTAPVPKRTKRDEEVERLAKEYAEVLRG